LDNENEAKKDLLHSENTVLKSTYKTWWCIAHCADQQWL